MDSSQTNGGPSSPAPSTKVRWVRWLVLLILVGVVAGLLASGILRAFQFPSLKEKLETFELWRSESPLALGLGFLVVYFLVTALSLPAAGALTVLAGALFGRVLGTGLVSLASTLGATAAMLMSRFVLRDWVRRRLGPRVEPLERNLAREGPYYLFFLRLVPAVPFFLINLGMGLTTMPVWQFALVSWVGMLPGTFLYVNAGTEIGRLESMGDVWKPELWGAFFLLGLGPLAIRWAAKRLRGNRSLESKPD